MKRKEDFKTMLSEWLLEKPPATIARDIKIPLSASYIASITGPRRAGKTFLMYDTIRRLGEEKGVPKSNILYVNFEHERLRNLDASDLEDLMTAFYEMSQPDDRSPIYLFLDEIQVVKDWSKWVNRMHGKKKFKLYISGSSSKLLSRELSTELRGRSADFTVLPLSFAEYLKFRNFTVPRPDALLFSEQRGSALRQLKDYMTNGSYPEIAISPSDSTKLLRSYLDTTIIKDVGERHRIEPSILRTFVEYAMDNCGKYVSGTKTYNYLKTLNYKISRDFPLRLFSYFNEAFALFPVEIYSRSTKSRKQYPRKMYSVDSGMVRMASRNIDYGHIMENVVFLELFRRSDALSGFSVNYWKEYGKSEGREVDFVISDGSRVKELINVTYASSREDIRERETEGIIEAGRELKCSNLKIITWDYYERGDIEFMPLWYWLLSGARDN